MKISKKNKKALNIVIRGVRLEEQDQFKCLAGMISKNAKCSKELE